MIKDIDSLEELKSLYAKHFSLGFIHKSINEKFALISLICYLKQKLSEKNPKVTYYQIIKKIIGDKVPEKFVITLSILCEDFGYGCSEFPTFGITEKQIPNKIKEVLLSWIPF